MRTSACKKCKLETRSLPPQASLRLFYSFFTVLNLAEKQSDFCGC